MKSQISEYLSQSYYVSNIGLSKSLLSKFYLIGIIKHYKLYLVKQL